MWKFLLAAVVGCTGFAAKHLFSSKTHPLLVPTFSEQTTQCKKDNAVSRSPSSKSRPKKTMIRSKNRVRISMVEVKPVVEIRSKHRKGEKRLRFCLKSSKTTRNIGVKPVFCSCKDICLFDWGVNFGVMCMMAGKAEISELSNTMNKTAKNVEELKFELSRRKSSCALHQTMDSDENIGMEPAVSGGGGECGSSSALTEEQNNIEALEMDQLEAELEFELQKLQRNANLITMPFM